MKEIVLAGKGGTGQASAASGEPTEKIGPDLVALAHQAYRSCPGLYRIGDENPFVGRRVRVTWAKPWGGKPAGFTATGKLARTMVVNGGRTLIGEVITDDGRRLSCPWSRNWLVVQLLEEVKQ